MNPTAFAAPPDTRSPERSPARPERASDGGRSADTHAIRVYVIDQHPLFLHGMAALLNPERGLVAAGMATTLAQALDEAQSLTPDVVLVDMLLPGCRGAESIALLRTLLPQARVLGITCNLWAEEARAALAAGATGYLLKTATAEELQAAFRTVILGRVALSPAVRAALETRADRVADEPPLTRREHDLLALLARGLGNKAIAEAMAVSIPTVKFHVTNVLSKLRADNRTAAVVKAVQRHLINL